MAQQEHLRLNLLSSDGCSLPFFHPEIQGDPRSPSSIQSQACLASGKVLSPKGAPLACSKECCNRVALGKPIPVFWQLRNVYIAEVEALLRVCRFGLAEKRNLGSNACSFTETHLPALTFYSSAGYRMEVCHCIRASENAVLN